MKILQSPEKNKDDLHEFPVSGAEWDKEALNEIPKPASESCRMIDVYVVVSQPETDAGHYQCHPYDTIKKYTH